MKKWLRWLWQNENGFFGIGQGPSQQEKLQYGATADLADFATGEGEKDILASDKFWQAILSGDPGQISRVLGPETSAVNKTAQQQKKTLSQFGTRSGGTTAESETIGDTTRSRLDTTIANLTGGAAGALGTSGSSLLSTGLSGHEAAFSSADTIQKQHAAQINDLFKSIGTVVGAAAPFIPGVGGAVAGAAGKSLSAGGGGGGNWWDNVNFPSDDSGGGGDIGSDFSSS